ncbi:reverse transcriptase [Phytophthora megakarya]|uniref:Reverse transcriptase n=1 Tax=Phytophthora megakarya TaxID=4795 RepID=A0A225W8M1_9STRA|nr:reverse transcriptase [Phytophthora megakarya]
MLRKRNFKGGDVKGHPSYITLELTKCTKVEDEILGAIAASITQRATIDDDLADIASRKEPKRQNQAPIPTVDREAELWVVSFDGSAQVKRGGSAFSAIVGSLPGSEVVKARYVFLHLNCNNGISDYLESLTMNEAEYNGLILGLDMLEKLDRKRLVRGEIDCKAPELTLLKQKALDRPRKESDHELNGSADSLASAALQRQGRTEVQGGLGYQDLVTLNRLDEILISKTEDPVVRVAVVTTRASRVRSPAGVMQENLIREMRVDRIKRAQEEEVWIAGMKKYLSGAIADLSQTEARLYGEITADYEVDKQDLLFYCPPALRSEDDRDHTVTLHWKEDIRAWGVPPADQGYVGECVDIKTEKGKPEIRGKSPGNLQATYPFRIIAMNHIPSLRRSHKGNTELLIWDDLFTGYVIAKSSSSQSTQTVAEPYEEYVFRRFGANEMIRHVREPGFMYDFFRALNKILGQRATMAYRPQANGNGERMVETATRALKMYVRDLDQKDWDEYAERLTFAINKAHDRIRGDTLTIWSTDGIRDRLWRLPCQSNALSGKIGTYGRGSRAQVNARLKEAIADRSNLHNENAGSHQIEAGSRVWLYLDRMKEGYARKLAHLWHGTFQVADNVNDFSVQLEVTGTGYQIFPEAHVSKLKLIKDFPDRPRVELTVDETDRLDYDEILLPEDSWVPSLGSDEYEVERISDARSGKRTRFGRIYREFLVHWVGYDEPTWVDEADVNCGAILNTFLRERANRNLFNVMQSHEEM